MNAANAAMDDRQPRAAMSACGFGALAAIKRRGPFLAQSGLQRATVPGSFTGAVSRIIIMATNPTALANNMYQAGASALPVR